MMKLSALLALAGTASALLPVIVPMSDNANDTQLTWGPVTADISARDDGDYFDAYCGCNSGGGQYSISDGRLILDQCGMLMEQMACPALHDPGLSRTFL